MPTDDPESFVIEYPGTDYEIEVILSIPRHITIWEGMTVVERCDSVDSALDWIKNH